MSTPLTVIARLTARPDQADLLGEALKQVVPPTRLEEGVITYRLHRDTTDPAVWLLYETWTSRQALDAHFRQPHMQALLARAPALLAREPELTLAEEVVV